jgi:hypothetical protein
MRQRDALETLLEEIRKKRAERASFLQSRMPKSGPGVPGSVYNPAGLLKSVRDAKPPRKDEPGSDEL